MRLHTSAASAYGVGRATREPAHAREPGVNGRLLRRTPATRQGQAEPAAGNQPN